MIKIINSHINKIQKGFTIVELMVVISIIAVVSVLTLFSSSQLNSSVLLSNTAYEIGLLTRDAQISGLGAKVLSLDGMATTSNQGLYFDFLSPEKVIMFADLNKNNIYNDLEESQIFVIEDKRAGKIMKICKILNDNSCEQISNVTVLFKRPNPEAYFYIEGDTNDYPGSIAINIGFNNQECRSIILYKTGGIQIDKSFCN